MAAPSQLLAKLTNLEKYATHKHALLLTIQSRLELMSFQITELYVGELAVALPCLAMHC